MNRVISKSYTDGVTPPVTYCYDAQTSSGGLPCPAAAPSNAIGHLTAVGSSVSTTQYTGFDTLGRAKTSQQVTGGTTYSFSYAYNLNGLLDSITYPSGRLVQYDFDDANRYITTASGSTTYAKSVTYTPHGAVNQAIFGGALTETTTFNSRLQATQILAGSLLSIGYTYNSTANNGNLLNQSINDGTNPVKTQTYSYDPLNRLATASEDSTWSQTYVYDPYGNRALYSTSNDPSAGVGKILLAMTASNTSVPFNSKNQWSGTGVIYDPRGNLTNVPEDAQDSFQANYDAENRNTSVTALVGGTSQTVNYAYDGDGKRVQKTVGGATTMFVYDAFGHLAAEYGSPNQDTGTVYFTADHLGSTRLATPINNGTVGTPNRSDYLPFGQEIPATWNRSNYVADSSQRIKFTSKERDSETGLDFFGARYMSSAQGRFTSPDPSANGVALQDPQSWNLYSYVRNRPTRFVDRNGNWATDVHAQLVTAALQGYVSAGELRQLVRQQYIMDQDQWPADQYMHAMANGQARPPQSSSAAAGQMWDWVAWNMNDANANLRRDGSFSDLSLLRLGNAIHTVQDYTSPEHVSAAGQLLPWNGSFRFGAAIHVLGEISPDEGWAGIGQAIRLTRAAFMQANPAQAASHGLTSATFEKEANRRINDYVDQFYNGIRIAAGETFERQREGARQCALLGNPAACGIN